MAAGRSFLDAAFMARNFQEIGDNCMVQLDLSIYLWRYAILVTIFTGVSQFYYPNETLFQEIWIKFYLQAMFLISCGNFWQCLYKSS